MPQDSNKTILEGNWEKRHFPHSTVEGQFFEEKEQNEKGQSEGLGAGEAGAYKVR